MFSRVECPKIVIFLTGGGGGFLQRLLSTAGASGCLLEAQVPYCSAARRELLRDSCTDGSAVSAEASEALAKVALRRCTELAYQEFDWPPGIPSGNSTAQSRGRKYHPFGCLVGIGCTAALATNRLRQGDDRCWITVASHFGGRTVRHTFDKGSALCRAQQDGTVSLMLLSALKAGADLTMPVDPPSASGLLEDPSQPFAGCGMERVEAPRSWKVGLTAGVEAVSMGRASHAIYWGATEALHLEAPLASLGGPTRRPSVLILPGAFNPLHSGHLELMRQAAARISGHEESLCLFEMSCVNADKGFIPGERILERLHHFRRTTSTDGLNVLLTRTPLFHEKAELFRLAGLRPNFVVGFDTFVRLLNPKYYSDSVGVVQALQAFRVIGCHFFVGGRALTSHDAFHTLSSHDGEDGTARLLADFADLFTELKDFRVDISSTEIRREKSFAQN